MYKSHTPLITATILAIGSAQGAIVFNDVWTNGSGEFPMGTGVAWNPTSGLAAGTIEADVGIDPATAPGTTT